MCVPAGACLQQKWLRAGRPRRGQPGRARACEQPPTPLPRPSPLLIVPYSQAELGEAQRELASSYQEVEHLQSELRSTNATGALLLLSAAAAPLLRGSSGGAGLGVLALHVAHAPACLATLPWCPPVPHPPLPRPRPH